jgi:hypothetical protein
VGYDVSPSRHSIGIIPHLLEEISGLGAPMALFVTGRVGKGRLQLSLDDLLARLLFCSASLLKARFRSNHINTQFDRVSYSVRLCIQQILIVL